VGAKWLISAVARVLNPGCKVDTSLFLEGPQGSFKSTALRILAGNAFSTDDIAELGSKDSVVQTRGVWIIELAELDSMTASEVSRVKAFISRQVDRIRLPYGRRVIEAKRECVFAGTTNVFAGTTNNDTYLKDESGGRRFWAVKVGVINLDQLQRDRNLLWAEARERFFAGNAWLDTQSQVAAASEEQQDRFQGDVWDEKIESVTKMLGWDSGWDTGWGWDSGHERQLEQLMRVNL